MKNKELSKSGLSTNYCDNDCVPLRIGDIVFQILIDEVEPAGYFLCFSIIEVWHGCIVVCQLGFDYKDKPVEEFTLLSEVYNEIFKSSKDEYYDYKNSKKEPDRCKYAIAYNVLEYGVKEFKNELKTHPNTVYDLFRRAFDMLPKP